MKSFYPTFLLSMLCLAATAQPVVLNDPNQAYYDFDEHLTALEVRPGQQLTIDSLLQHPERYRFAPYNRVLNAQRAYWFRITLTNPTPNNFFLRVRNVWYDVMVYETAGKTFLQQTRLSRTIAEGVETSRLSRTLVPLQVRDGQTHQVYLYVDHGNLLQSELHGALSLARRMAVEDLCYGIFYGLVLLTALYSFLLYARLKDTDNLIYGLWMLVLGFFMAFLVGHTGEWLSSWQQSLLRYSGVLGNLSGLLQLVFIITFLSLRQNSLWLYRIGQGQVVCIGLSMVIPILPTTQVTPYLLQGIYYIGLLYFPYVLISGIVALRHGNKAAWYILVGQSSLFISIQYFTYLASGLVPSTPWSFLSIHIGTAIEIICFTIGLSYKVNLLKKHQAEAIQEQLRLTKENQQLIETQNRVLEEKVEQRTAELRASQAQLIQKEKLASLGELTAGIAHEIQNPLNFVNNFSEVSTELVDELEEEADAGRVEEVKALAVDLRQNLQKINHHGSRASAIVRGMLEHSRTSTGEKQPTNLNALADEYLRLAYQGLRAKDQRFNCELDTDFATDLPHIDVVPRDMGRVLLNLYNNAFYAVQQKQKTAPSDYQPTVWVNTAWVNGQFQIRVRDNGTGIPDTVKEKIFQPFFTTKPTGEGTGLGLSLSYDIVTKGHGGTMDVESREGEGATFKIGLPVSGPADQPAQV